MNYVALRMLTGERAKYLGLVFAIAFSTFLLENQTSIFAGILKRTASQVMDVTDAEVWVMDPRTQYFEQTRALKDTDLFRVRGVPGVRYAVRLFKGTPVARAPDGTFSQTIALGLDDATLAGAPRKMLLGSWERLREPDTIVIDKAGYLLLFPSQPLELGRTSHEFEPLESPCAGLLTSRLIHKDSVALQIFEHHSGAIGRRQSVHSAMASVMPAQYF
jgi:putative ABC transport system permease protein